MVLTFLRGQKSTWIRLSLCAIVPVFNRTVEGSHFFAGASPQRGEQPKEEAEVPLVTGEVLERSTRVQDSNSSMHTHCHQSLIKAITIHSKVSFLLSEHACGYGDCPLEPTGKSSRTAGTLCRKLAESVKGPVDPGHSEEVPYRVHELPTPEEETTLEPLQHGPTEISGNRNCRAVPKRGGDRGQIHSISGPQEGRRPETSDQSEIPELLCGSSSFQNGRDSYSKESPDERRLVSKDRSQGLRKETG